MEPMKPRDVENVVAALALEKPVLLFTPTYLDLKGLPFGFYEIPNSSSHGRVLFNFGYDAYVGAARDPAIQFKTANMDCVYVISYDPWFGVPGRQDKTSLFYKAYTFLDTMPKQESGFSRDAAIRRWESFTHERG